MRLDTGNWMRYLDGSVKAVDTYIPSSHDASAYHIGDPLVDAKNDAVGSITQLANYTAQLNAGSRYFDMRVVFDDGVLKMKHADYKFQKFADVLDQLERFAAEHTSEFLFLDLDFDHTKPELSEAIKAELISSMHGERNFCTIHALPEKIWKEDTHEWEDRHRYNTELTWGQLREHGKQFIVLWQDNVHSNKPWAPQARDIRDNFEEDFNTKFFAHEILSFLDSKLASWTKQKLFVAQVINTPLASPLRPPSSSDSWAEEDFNNWIMSKKTGDNLGIVKRDFINAGYNRNAIAHVIRLNTFTSPPEVSGLTDPIHYQDLVKLRSLDGRYLSLNVVYPPDICLVKMVGSLDENCRFYIRDHDYHPTKQIMYCGNLDTKDTDCRGNFRLEHRDWRPAPYNVGDDYVLSIDKNQQNRLYWGVHWNHADDFETFAFYDPDDLQGNGPIYNGSRVWIRSMMTPHNSWWATVVEKLAEPARWLSLLGPGPLFKAAGFLLSPLLGRVANSANTKTYLMLANDADHVQRVFAASPDTTLASTFIIEKWGNEPYLPDESHLGDSL